MILWMFLAVGLTLTSANGAQSSDTFAEETLYHSFKKNIENTNKQNTHLFLGFSSFEQSLFVDALWDHLEENPLKASEYLKHGPPAYYNLVQKLRIGILRIKYNEANKLPDDLTEEIINSLKSLDADIKLVYLIAAYEAELTSAGHTELINLAKNHPAYFDVVLDEDHHPKVPADIISDLIYKTPDVATYMNGEYVKSVKVFMFCRNNRLYPCLMVMKNAHGETLRDKNDILWSHPALASSAKGLPSFYRNGNTPEGIYTIDSVMPFADSQRAFGQYRRMILNFVPKSEDEVLLKSLLPPSSQQRDWWRASTVARDMGRNLFRIHGSGKRNLDPATPYYPFMRTSGCVAQRENTYDGITYKDQRDLLDTIMKAMDLLPKYENEPEVKGILYVIEIDDKNAPVTLKDLTLRGIE